MARDVADGLLFRLPPYDDPPAIDIYLVTNPTARLNRAEAGFLAALRARRAQALESERVFPPSEGAPAGG